MISTSVLATPRRGAFAWTLLGILLAGLVGPASAQSTSDLSLAFRTRTVLVNDPVVGAANVQVAVSEGVVTLTGFVASAEQVGRVVALVGGVPGVLRVEDQLAIATDGAEAATVQAVQRRLSTLTSPGSDPPARRFALGGGIALPSQSSDTLDAGWSLTPIFRFGRGMGWHPSLAWTRLRSNLPPAVAGGEPFGALRLSAVTVGLGYALAGERWAFDPSVTGGYSFNHIRLDPTLSAPRRDGFPVAASGSPALLLKTTVWFEATARLSVALSSGYLLTRPSATWLEGDAFTQKRLKADTWLWGVSLAYWVF